MARQKRIPTPSWQHDGGVRDITADRMKLYGLFAVVALVLGAIGVIGWGFLSDYLDEHNRPTSTAVKVNDYRYNVRDFTKRAKLYIDQIGGTTTASIILPTVSSQIIEEGILIQSAGEKGATVSDAEVKDQIATLMGITAADPNYEARFQEELKNSGLTAEQYTDMARGAALQKKLIDVFTAALPETLQSIHYRQIQVADQTTADDLKTQIDDGADFAELAAANSLDTATKDKGGDAGWAPKGYLSAALENLLFDTGQGETVTYPTQNGVTIYQIIEGDDARAIDDDKKTTLASQDFNDWLNEKKAAAKVTNDMDTSTGNADKIKYVVENAGLTAQ